MQDSTIRSCGRWLSHFDWSEVTNLTDINQKYDLFIQTLQNAIDEFFPIRKNKLHPTDKPWTSTRVKSLIRSRQAAFHRNDMTSWKILKKKVIVAIAYS